MEYFCGTIADILIAMLSKLPTSDYLLLLLVKGSYSESCLTILCLRAGCSLTGYKKVCISLNGNIKKIISHANTSVFYLYLSSSLYIGHYKHNHKYETTNKNRLSCLG